MIISRPLFVHQHYRERLPLSALPWDNPFPLLTNKHQSFVNYHISRHFKAVRAGASPLILRGKNFPSESFGASIECTQKGERYFGFPSSFCSFSFFLCLYHLRDSLLSVCLSSLSLLSVCLSLALPPSFSHSLPFYLCLSTPFTFSRCLFVSPPLSL